MIIMEGVSSSPMKNLNMLRLDKSLPVVGYNELSQVYVWVHFHKRSYLTQQPANASFSKLWWRGNTRDEQRGAPQQFIHERILTSFSMISSLSCMNSPGETSKVGNEAFPHFSYEWGRINTVRPYHEN